MLIFLLAFSVPALTSAAKWKGMPFDGSHFEACYRGQFVNGFKSMHSPTHKDRRWSISCGGHPDYIVNDECKWSGWINKADHRLSFQCPSGSVVTGLQSYKVPGHSDRRYQVRCCELTHKRAECPNGKWGVACQFTCNCPDNALCSKEDGSCPGACPPGKWGFRCLFDDGCHYDTDLSLYAGHVNTTSDGTPCQAWAKQEPHAHKYRLGSLFTDKSLPENFCRSAVTTKGQQPWCFTTDAKTRWQPCNVQKCDCPRGLWGPACDRECHCAGDAKACDREGRCASGCAPGWTGETCQVMPKPTFASCKLSGYVNAWGKPMNAGLKQGSFFTGVFAAFDGRQDDRRFRFVTCQV